MSLFSRPTVLAARTSVPMGRSFPGRPRLVLEAGGALAGEEFTGLPDFDAISFATPATGCAVQGSPQYGADYASRDGGKTWRLARVTAVPAAVCAVSLTDPALARMAMKLIDKLAPVDVPAPALPLHGRHWRRKPLARTTELPAQRALYPGSEPGSSRRRMARRRDRHLDPLPRKRARRLRNHLQKGV